MTSDVIARYSGSAPVSATVRVLRDLPLRLVARYDLALADGTTLSVVGKWYAIDRGAVVASELEYLSGIGLPVAPLLGYWPDVRLLLTAWVPGRMLTQLLVERADTAIAVARAAGRWAARLHSSDMPTPRSCGPAKQRASLTKWRDTSAEVADLADRVARALVGHEDPGRPVHYDHHHGQVVASQGHALVLALDERGRVGAPCRVPEGWPGDVPAEADADGGEILTIEDLIVVGTDSLSTICCTSPTCAVRLSALETAARPELEPRS